MRTRVEDLLSEEYAARRRALISEQALTPEAGDPLLRRRNDLSVHRRPTGNMVSFIQSNYTTFGAGWPSPDRHLPPEPGPTSPWTRGATTAWPEGSGPITPSSPGS